MQLCVFSSHCYSIPSLTSLAGRFKRPNGTHLQFKCLFSALFGLYIVGKLLYIEAFKTLVVYMYLLFEWMCLVIFIDPVRMEIYNTTLEIMTFFNIDLLDLLVCVDWYMGQTTKVHLYCYPVLLSIVSKPGNKTSALMWPGGRFKNTYELWNQRALKFSYVNKIHIFQCMGKIFCVEFQRYPLKFHTKYLTHALKDMIFMQFWNFKSS